MRINAYGGGACAFLLTLAAILSITSTQPSWATNLKLDSEGTCACAFPPNNSQQLCPSISTEAKVSRQPEICHPERTPDFLLRNAHGAQVCCFP